MADYTLQRVNELPIANPVSGDYLMGIGSSNEYRSTIDVIARYIINTAKTINNQTVQESLDSKIQSLSLSVTDDGNGNVALTVSEE